MLVFILLLVIIGVVVLLVIILKNVLVVSNMMWHFKHCNVIVSGKKGSGKDLLFQYVINKRHDYYYSNIPYGGKNKVIKLKSVSAGDNSYDRIVNDQIEKQPHMFKDKKDIYISDIGIYLPSYMDNKLYVKFPSMPIFYAMSRQLYDNNVHCNTQNIERGWKALREQADFYIEVKRTYKIFCFLITKFYTYDTYQSAKDHIRPVKTRLFNKYSKAEVDIYNAKAGDIRQGFIIQPTWKIKYDTRYFEKVLLKGRRK